MKQQKCRKKRFVRFPSKMKNMFPKNEEDEEEEQQQFCNFRKNVFSISESCLRDFTTIKNAQISENNLIAFLMNFEKMKEMNLAGVL